LPTIGDCESVSYALPQAMDGKDAGCTSSCWCSLLLGKGGVLWNENVSTSPAEAMEQEHVPPKGSAARCPHLQDRGAATTSAARLPLTGKSIPLVSGRVSAFFAIRWGDFFR
jgi:hypothetical protein